MDLSKILKDLLPGNKTYLAAAILAFAALLYYRAGDSTSALAALSQALGLIGLRAALPGTQPTPPTAPTFPPAPTLPAQPVAPVQPQQTIQL